jgi:hypothetical protein
VAVVAFPPSAFHAAFSWIDHSTDRITLRRFNRSSTATTRSLCAAICKSNGAALFGAVVWQATDRRPKRLSWAKVTSRERKLMTTLQAVFLGMMLAWTPAVALVAFLFWQEGIGLDDPKTEWPPRY